MIYYRGFHFCSSGRSGRIGECLEIAVLNRFLFARSNSAASSLCTAPSQEVGKQDVLFPQRQHIEHAEFGGCWYKDPGMWGPADEANRKSPSRS